MAKLPVRPLPQGSKRGAAALQAAGRPLTEALTPQLKAAKRRHLHSTGSRSQVRLLSARDRCILSALCVLCALQQRVGISAAGKEGPRVVALISQSMRHSGELGPFCSISTGSPCKLGC